MAILRGIVGGRFVRLHSNQVTLVPECKFSCVEKVHLEKWWMLSISKKKEEKVSRNLSWNRFWKVNLTKKKSYLILRFFRQINFAKYKYVHNLRIYLLGDSFTGVLLASPFKFTSSKELSGNFNDKNNLLLSRIMLLLELIIVVVDL